jgi:hypothetical protein
MGYGVIRVDDDRPREYAHRVAFFLNRGRWPSVGMCIMHRCDVPLCVNPAHLREATFAENVLDAKAKGRLATGDRNAMSRPAVRAKMRGVRNPSARLSEAQAMEIYNLRQQGVSIAVLTDRFQVSRSLVCLIGQGKRWGWLARANVPQLQLPLPLPVEVGKAAKLGLDVARLALGRDA